mgnify:CR=1 FL=1
MAKFLNKKEQVLNIELTPYGRHQMSMGVFKPEYYAFFDDNIIYDGKHAGITETQNEIGQRIKKERQSVFIVACSREVVTIKALYCAKRNVYINTRVGLCQNLFS